MKILLGLLSVIALLGLGYFYFAPADEAVSSRPVLSEAKKATIAKRDEAKIRDKVILDEAEQMRDKMRARMN